MTKVIYEITFPNGTITTETSYKKTLAVVAAKGGHYRVIYEKTPKPFKAKTYKPDWWRQ